MRKSDEKFGDVRRLQRGETQSLMDFSVFFLPLLYYNKLYYSLLDPLCVAFDCVECRVVQSEEAPLTSEPEPHLHRSAVLP